MTDLQLPKRLQQLYDALKGQGDVKWEVLAGAIDCGRKDRDAAQWLGPYVTRLNRRLVKHGLAVKPGTVKQTLRLIVI